MLQCFVCSPIPKVSEKNGQPVGQSFIRKEITSYRIGTLAIHFLVGGTKMSMNLYLADKLHIDFSP